MLPLEGLWNLFTATNKVKQTSIYMFANSIVTIAIVLVALHFTDDDHLKLYIIAGTSTAFSVFRSLVFLPVYGAHCLNIKWTAFYPSILKNTLSVVVASAFAVLLRNVLNIDGWLMLIVAGALTSIFALAFNFIVLLNKEERRTFLNRVTRR